jgi:hypothetical protein
LIASPFSIVVLRNSCQRARVIAGMGLQSLIEEAQVLGRDLVEKVASLIHEGNVRRLIIKDENGNTFIEIPVTIAAVGVIMAPVLAAVGAISAHVAKFTVVIERADETKKHNGNVAE